MRVERDLLPGDVITFTYTNWKGRTAVRTVEYERMTIGKSQMPDSHIDSLELYLRGHDLDKQSARCFHVSGIHQGTVEYRASLGTPQKESPSPDCECDPSKGCGVIQSTEESPNV